MAAKPTLGRYKSTKHVTNRATRGRVWGMEGLYPAFAPPQSPAPKFRVANSEEPLTLAANVAARGSPPEGDGLI